MNKLALLILAALTSLGCRVDRPIDLLPSEDAARPYREDDYRILGLLIDSIYAADHDTVLSFVAEDSTVTQTSWGTLKQDSDGNWVPAANALPSLEQSCPVWRQFDSAQLGESYTKMNARHSPLVADSIKTPLRPIRLSHASFLAIMHEGGWALFNKTFPGSNGVICFSRIAFNAVRNQAAVYVQQYLPLPGASGAFVLLQKHNGLWTLKCKTVTWRAAVSAPLNQD